MVPESSPVLPKVNFHVQVRVPLKPRVHGHALVAGRTMELPSGLLVGIVIVYTKVVSILNSVVHVVAKDPAPNFAELTGKVAAVLLSFDVNGKLQLCLGGLTGAQVVRGFEFLQSDT